MNISLNQQYENKYQSKATDEQNTPNTIPNSYHSSQFESVSKTDSHGTSEQTILTETCRITETTMRLEHKSPLPDIELNLSPRPFETRDKFECHAKTPIEIIPPKQQQNHTEHDQLIAPKTIENTQHTIFKTATINETQNINQIETLPKTSYSSVSNRVKTLEQVQNEERTANAYKPFPTWNTSFESPATPVNFSVQIQKEVASPTFTQMNGSCTPNPVHDTIEKISDKVQEYQHSYWSNDYDLKAPALVKHAMPVFTPHTNEYESAKRDSLREPIYLQPGEPPEICYAPRTMGERKVSIVEKIEKSLERDLERGPSKVLPHSVRTMPPSPQTTAFADPNESIKHNIFKGHTQQEFTEQNKDFNHIKNIFYEHNKPLQRKTHDQVPTPTLAPPDKVRTACFRVHTLNVLKFCLLIME